MRPGGAFPPVGRWGLASPPSPGLCAAKTAPLPRSDRCAWRSRPDTWPAPLVRGRRFRLGARGKPPGATPGWWSPPAPQPGHGGQEPGGAPTFRSDPSGDRPRSQPPVVSWALALSRPGRLPSGQGQPSACPSRPPGGRSSGPRLYPLRGAMARPASSLPPAPDSPGWGCPGRSLPTWWLGVGRVGLAPDRLAPTGEPSPVSCERAQSQGFRLTLARPLRG